MPAPATDPRKRPRQARSAATFELILEGAARILEQGGLEAFNTNAIAEKAGVSVGSLYQYFPSKDAILTELIRRKRAALLEDMRSAAREGRERDLVPALDGLVGAALSRHLARPMLARSLEYAEAMLPIDGETETVKREIVAVVATVLEAHGIADPITAARDLVALTRGMMDTMGLFGETDPVTLRQRVRRAALGYLELGENKAR